MEAVSERVLPEWAKAKDGEVIWLDDDHAVIWSQWPGETEPNGGILWHRKPDNQWCCGAWYIRYPEYKGKPYGVKVDIWILESKKPLTLSPSFLCHCGHHGFIKSGKWVQA